MVSLNEVETSLAIGLFEVEIASFTKKTLIFSFKMLFCLRD